MGELTLPQRAALENLRGNPVIVYASTITDESVRVLYECLRRLGKTERLDLVLSTAGGPVTTAHKLALLLREYTQHLTILVPYRARSAGTLLCLSANELVLSSMAELSPIDTHIGIVASSPDAPGLISAQDVRAFRQMAEDWFGVTGEEDRLQVLALVAQRIFPTSLSSFYRSDRLIRQIANELLTYQLPDADTKTRQRIVDQLVEGYYAHDYIISRTEAQRLGLQVRFTSSEEETLLWNVYLEYQSCIAEHSGLAEQDIIGMIAGPGFSALQESHWRDTSSLKPGKMRNGEVPPMEKMRDIRWNINI